MTRLSNNIEEHELLKIIEKFCPLYHQMDQTNRDLVKRAYREFFEDALKDSFQEARNAGNV